MVNQLTGVSIGLIGGILGTLLGISGGALGTYISIKNTDGPLERNFMIKAAVAAWISISVFLLLLIILPIPYNFMTWLPYGILLPLAIRYVNQRQLKIKKAESETVDL